ncbi:hypothetical protein ACFL04_04385 [Patescibacteria group bacterium]
MGERQAWFGELLNDGLSYRYQLNHFAKLCGGGHPYVSPVRLVRVKQGEMIEEMIQPTVEPYVMSSEDLDWLNELARAWNLFAQAQANLILQARRGGLDEYTVELIRQTCSKLEWDNFHHDPGYFNLMPFARLDLIRTEQGLKVIDINSTRPAGLGDIDVLSRAYQSNCSDHQPLPVAEVLKELVEQCSREWNNSQHHSEQPIKVGIVINQSDGDWQNFRNIMMLLTSQGIDAELVDPENAQSNPNTWNVLIRSRIKEGHPYFSLFEQDYPHRRCVMSPLYRRCLGNKIWMYLINSHGPTKRFFADELGQDFSLIADCFPQTGLVLPDGMVDFGQDSKQPLTSLAHKEWVLKQPAASSARQFHMGCLMGKRKWQDTLNLDLQGWIVQPFSKAKECLLVHDDNGEVVEKSLYVKFGAYLYGGRLAAVEIHARNHPIVHGARNTYFSCVMKKS